MMTRLKLGIWFLLTTTVAPVFLVEYKSASILTSTQLDGGYLMRTQNIGLQLYILRVLALENANAKSKGNLKF